MAFADDARLIRRHRSGDRHARELLIRRHLPLARRLAWRYRRSSVPMDDLVQVASLGLVKAVDRWDPERGFALSSYAVPTIVGELRHHLRDTTWAVRPPRDLLELAVAVEQLRMKAPAGREPTAAELAERLGRSREAVEHALLASEGHAVFSLDARLDDDAHASAILGDLVGHDDRGYDAVETRATLERLLAILDDRAREVLRLRFEDDLHQFEIAQRIGCSQMHVSRILRKALDQLCDYAQRALSGHFASTRRNGTPLRQRSLSSTEAASLS